MMARTKRIALAPRRSRHTVDHAIPRHPRGLHRDHGRRRQKPSPPAARLDQPGLAADITWVTSPGLLHRAVRAARGTRTPNRIPATVLDLTRSGQPGSPENVCRHHGPDADAIIRAALDLAS
jgi:hypothetical protein